MKTQKEALSAAERAALGMRVGIIGIACNALLFLMKFLIGSAVGSLAICADAFNNLSDAGASCVSYVSFHISAKPADREHPFGHARMEYIASMIVSFLILLVAFELGSDAVKSILSPAKETDFSIAAVAAMLLSILVKLGLAAYNLRIGRRIDSDVMRATATDCLSDCISSSAVLASSIILLLSGVSIDAYVGLAVSVLILTAGVRILLETKNSLLGEGPTEELTMEIKRIIDGYPAVLGIHDLVVHSYGPGHSFATLHAEVDGRGDILDLHDLIDTVEKRISTELSIACTIHLDPLVVGDGRTDSLRAAVTELAHAIDPRLHIHDFRMVAGPTHSNLIFDVEVPFEMRQKDGEIVDTLAKGVNAIDPTYFTVIEVDRI